MTSAIVVVPCPHRMPDGEKCPGHLVEIEVRDGVIITPPAADAIGEFHAQDA